MLPQQTVNLNRSVGVSSECTRPLRRRSSSKRHSLTSLLENVTLRSPSSTESLVEEDSSTDSSTYVDSSDSGTGSGSSSAGGGRKKLTSTSRAELLSLYRKGPPTSLPSSTTATTTATSNTATNTTAPNNLNNNFSKDLYNKDNNNHKVNAKGKGGVLSLKQPTSSTCCFDETLAQGQIFSKGYQRGLLAAKLSLHQQHHVKSHLVTHHQTHTVTTDQSESVVESGESGESGEEEMNAGMFINKKKKKKKHIKRASLVEITTTLNNHDGDLYFLYRINAGLIEVDISTQSACDDSSSKNIKKSAKKLRFNDQVLIGQTYPSSDYDRRGDRMKLTPWLAWRIKLELNQYKATEMKVHASSLHHTHFLV